MLYGMDRDRLLRETSDLEDPTEVSRLIAEALLSAGSPGDDPLDADLARLLGEAQIRLGHEVRGRWLLDAAVRWAPDGPNLTALRIALQEAGEDFRAVARLRALLSVSPDAGTQLFYLYLDLGCPVLALDAARQARGTSASARLRRWRLWWSTGGPFWFIRAAKRRRETADMDGRLGNDDDDALVEPLLRAVAADVDADRFAWQLVQRVDRLADERDLVAAARLLVEPISAVDRHPRVLHAAVDLATRVNDAGLALQFCAGLPPGTNGLAALRAELMLSLDRLRDAWTLMDDGAAAEDFRDVRARILIVAGLPYLAVDVRREVSFGRSEWRRRWWRTGGPLRWLRARGRRQDKNNLEDRLGKAQTGIEELEPAALATALVRAAEVSEAIDEATPLQSTDEVAVLAAVYDPDRPSVPLLDQLAWSLYLDDQEELALQRVREARALEPAKASLFETELIILAFLERYFEASEVADRYTEEFGRPAAARARVGDLADDLGLFALSLEAFGSAEGLSLWARSLRRKQWWRTGGPLSRWRAWIRRTDVSTLQSWQRRAEAMARVLGSVVGPEQVAGLRVVSDRFTFQEARRRLKWERLNVVVRLSTGYACSMIGGLVLAHLVGDLAPLTFLAYCVVGTLIVFGLLRLVYRFTQAEPGDRILTRVLPAIAAVAVTGYLVTRLGGRVPLLVGATVVAAAAAAAARLIAAGGARVAEAMMLRRLRRTNPRGFALVSLLDVLAESGRPALRNDLGWRRQRLQTLEQVAVALETALPAAFAADPAITEVLRRRGQRAAASIRELKYLLAAAPPGAWRRIEAVLRQDVTALATGSLARLQAVTPPAAQARRRSRVQITAHAARTLFFAGLPLAVVVFTQPWLRFNEAILNWARLLTVGWAVLYVLLTADPTFRDKLRTGFALINLGRGVGDPAQLDPPVPEKRSEANRL